MYEIIKNVINSRLFELKDMLKKINVCWVQSEITEEQKDELVKLAQEKVNPENSYAPLQKQLEKAFDEIKALKEIVQTQALDIKAIKNKLAEGGTVVPEPEPQPQDEYPEYVQPQGAHDAYHKGDKVTYNGKKYECIAPDGVAVVWSPDVMPSYWQEVTE